jgi:hypothetical protein
MQDPNKKRKKRGKLYFSSTKALRTSRMGRKKMATERYDTIGINEVLDFEDIGENATLSTVDETQEGPSTSRGQGSQSQGASQEMGTEVNPADNPPTEEKNADEDFGETSLMEPEGGFQKPYALFHVLIYIFTTTFLYLFWVMF